MRSAFTPLTDVQERSTTVHWITKPIKNYPGSKHKLAAVVAVILTHYVPDWVPHFGVGSIALHRRRGGPDEIKVFIDDGNRLAMHFGLKFTDEPIVVGVDLTDRDPFERHCIRAELRNLFGPNYIDPEANPSGPPSKITVVGDHEHYLEVMFVTDGICDTPADSAQLARILAAI